MKITRYLFLCILFLTPLSANNVFDKETSPKYYLSICAIFRDEARFLREWIEYHQMLGVEHFYLFNNLSNDDYALVLQPYIDQGIVELYEWPFGSKNNKHWIFVQQSAYRKILHEKKFESFWLAIIDTDEFIVPTKHKNIPNFLANFEEYGAVGINWQVYGTSEIWQIPENQTLIEHLIKKTKKNAAVNYRIKSIVQPKTVKKINSVHFCFLKPGHQFVSEKHTPLPFDFLSPTVSVDFIRINHYMFRDEKFFQEVKMTRMSLPGWPKRDLNMDQYQIDDFIMQKFVKELEKRLFDIEKTN